MTAKSNTWAVIYCPKTGAFRPHKRWQRIERCLKEQQVKYDFVQSENAAGVGRLVKMMVDNGYHYIIIVGGDSALNDAANAIMMVPAKERENVRLGVIPNGRFNDFAHFWDYQENDVEQVIKSLKKGNTRKIDLGCIRYTNKNGERCHRYFLNSLTIGLVASVMNMRRKTRSIIGSKTLAYIPSTLLMIFQRLEYKMHLNINADEVKRKVMTVCIGNASGYGFTPSAVPYNGLLDVSVVYHPQMAQLFEGLYLLYSGKILNHKSVHPYRTREITVQKAERASIGIDGRLMNTPVGPFCVCVEQEVLHFIVP